jgi:putative lipoic acid-binding regulatory protein
VVTPIKLELSASVGFIHKELTTFFLTSLAECDPGETKRPLKMEQSHLGLPHNVTFAALICRNSQLEALHGDLLYQISHKSLKTI